MAVTPQGETLTRTLNTAMSKVRQLTGAAAEAQWRRLTRYDSDRVDGFLASVTPIVAAGQRQAVALAAGYWSAYMTAETGVPESPAGLVPDGIVGPAVRAGTPPEDVYRRPFVQTWAMLGRGERWQQAVAAGAARVRSSAEVDVMLAHRAAVAVLTAGDDRVVGYRRVLSGASCRLCAGAANGRYSPGELMPVHNHCDCTSEPVLGRLRPSQVTDTARARALEAQADRIPDLELDTSAVRVVEHGELGPLVWPADADFTGPDGLAA